MAKRGTVRKVLCIVGGLFVLAAVLMFVGGRYRDAVRTRELSRERAQLEALARSLDALEEAEFTSRANAKIRAADTGMLGSQFDVEQAVLNARKSALVRKKREAERLLREADMPEALHLLAWMLDVRVKQYACDVNRCRALDHGDVQQARRRALEYSRRIERASDDAGGYRVAGQWKNESEFAERLDRAGQLVLSGELDWAAVNIWDPSLRFSIDR
jgi:hypothetical protein